MVTGLVPVLGWTSKELIVGLVVSVGIGVGVKVGVGVRVGVGVGLIVGVGVGLSVGVGVGDGPATFSPQLTSHQEVNHN